MPPHCTHEAGPRIQRDWLLHLPLSEPPTIVSPNSINNGRCVRLRHKHQNHALVCLGDHHILTQLSFTGWVVSHGELHPPDLKQEQFLGGT